MLRLTLGKNILYNKQNGQSKFLGRQLKVFNKAFQNILLLNFLAET